jgi:hypothetical protein
MFQPSFKLSLWVCKYLTVTKEQILKVLIYLCVAASFIIHYSFTKLFFNMPSSLVFFHFDFMCCLLYVITFLKLEYEIELCYFHIELFIVDFLINQIEIILVESEWFWW